MMDAKEPCYNCDGTGEVHSHNPTCWVCHGTGKLPVGSYAALMKRRAEIEQQHIEEQKTSAQLREENISLAARVAELEGVLREAVKIVRGVRNICNEGDRAVAYGVQRRIEHALAAAGKPGGGA